MPGLKRCPRAGAFPHTKVDEATGELLFFNYGKEAPYMHYGVVDARGALVHHTPIPLPGPRLPHDMAFTEHYAILCDFPLFWDAEALKVGAHAVRYHADCRHVAVIPRRVRPTRFAGSSRPYLVLHFMNATRMDRRSCSMDSTRRIRIPS